MRWFSSSSKAKVTQSRRNKSRADLRRALFEQLEPRQVMDAVPLVWAGTTLDATDDILEGFPDIQELPASVAGPQTTDAGDYYYYFSDQIDLLRAQDEFVVAYDSEEDLEDLLAALTGSGDPLEGYEHEATLKPGQIVLKRPTSIAYTAIDLEDVEAIDGVLWASPVFVNENSGSLAIATDEILVALETGVNPATFFATGYASWERFVDNQYLAVLSDGGLNTLTTANTLALNADVEWAAPNFFIDVKLNTNDPLYNDQWTLRNTSQYSALNDADADVDLAWNATTGSSDIVVAVLDTGVDLAHPDLRIFTNTGETGGGKETNGIDDDGNGYIDDYRGWDFRGDGLIISQDNNPSPGTTSSDAHGTSVAGIIAAIGGNSTGITGVSQNAKILPVKIANANGFVGSADLAKAVYYAAGAVFTGGVITGSWRGADVINASWRTTEDPGLTAAFNWAASSAKGGNGIPVFVASGNSAAGRQGSGTEQYNGIVRNVDLFSAHGNSTWSWVVSYKKDASGTAGEDAVRLGRFVNDDGTNTRWTSASTAPSGWSMTPFVGQDGWAIEDNPARAHGTARYQAKSGAIGNSDEAYVMAPAISISSGNPILSGQFYTFQSSAVSDTMNVYLWKHGTGGGLFTLSNGTIAGVNPTIVQAIDVDVAYPANLSSVIAVGASTDWDQRSHYSQYGSALDLVAPSGGGYANVTTTDISGSSGSSSGNYTVNFSGTSSAAPLSAGIAALMLSANPYLTAAQVKSFLQNTADKIGGNNGAAAYDINGFNQYYGYGRVNAATAVYAVFNPSAPDLTDATDTGLLFNDNIITHTSGSASVTLNATAPANSYIALYNNGTFLTGHQLTGGNTTHSFNVTLSTTTNNLYVRIAESSSTPENLRSNPSVTLTVTLDNTAALTKTWTANTTTNLRIANTDIATTITATSGTPVTMTITTPSGVPTLTKTGSGTATFTGFTAVPGQTRQAFTYAANAGLTRIEANAGTPVTSYGTANLELVSVVVSNSGSQVIFDATQNLAGLTINTGATAIAELSSSKRDMLVMGTLTMNGTALLDINNYDIVVRYASGGSTLLGTINTYLDNFYNDVTTSPRISSGAVTSAGGTRIAAGINNIDLQFGDTGNAFNNQYFGNSSTSTGFNQVIIRYTYAGDYNLDGQVDGADYAVVDSNIGNPVPGGVGGWTLGDGDFDGDVDSADYAPIDTNFGSGVGDPE